MAAKRKWNPQTGRFEAASDSSPTAAAPAKPVQGPVVARPTTGRSGATAPVAKIAQPAQQVQGGRGVTPGYTGQQYKDYAVENALNQTAPQGAAGGITLDQLQALLGDGGASAAAAKAAQEAAMGRAAYGGGMRSAADQEAAAQQAQAMYNQLAASEYDRMKSEIAARYNPQLEALNKYYTGAQSGATEAINAASQQAMTSLVNPTAYQDLQAALLTAPQQALDIGQYGATGELAAKQSAADAESAKFISDLLNRGYKQTQAVNTDYLTSLKNASVGSQQQALQQLVNTVAGLRAQDTSKINQAQQAEMSAADEMRNKLIQSGIEAMFSGKTGAAQTRAETEAKYGAYKPKGGDTTTKEKAPAKSAKAKTPAKTAGKTPVKAATKPTAKPAQKAASKPTTKKTATKKKS